MFHVTVGEQKPRSPALVLRSEPFMKREQAEQALRRLEPILDLGFVAEVFPHRFPGSYWTPHPVPRWALELRDFG